MKRAIPQEVRNAQAAYRAGKITKAERDRRMTQVATRDIESAGLRSIAGVETRIVSSRPIMKKAREA